MGKSVSFDADERHIEIKKKGLNLRLDLEASIENDEIKIEVKDSAGAVDSWNIDAKLKPVSERIDY